MISTKVFCQSNKPQQAAFPNNNSARYSIQALSTPTRSEVRLTSKEEWLTLFLHNSLSLMTINSRSSVAERNRNTTTSLAQAAPMSVAPSVARVHLVEVDLQMLLKLTTQNSISRELDIQDNLEAAKLLTIRVRSLESPVDLVALTHSDNV